MGVRLKKLKEDPLVMNLQPWLLNRYLAKKKIVILAKVYGGL